MSISIDAPLSGREQTDLADMREEHADRENRGFALDKFLDQVGGARLIRFNVYRITSHTPFSHTPVTQTVAEAFFNTLSAKKWLAKAGYSKQATAAVEEYLDVLYAQALQAVNVALDTGSLKYDYPCRQVILTNPADAEAIRTAATQIKFLDSKVQAVSDRLELAARKASDQESGSWWARRTERRRNALATLESYKALLASEQEMIDVTAGFVVSARNLADARDEVVALEQRVLR